MRIIIKPLGLAVFVLLIAAGFYFEHSHAVATPGSAAPAVPAAVNPAVPAAAPTSAPMPTRVSDTAGLVSARFNENGGPPTTTAGKGEFDAQIDGGATWVPGIEGSALHFDRVHQQFVDFKSPVVDTTRSFSVSCWVKMDDTTGYQTFVSQDGDDISAFYLQKNDLDGKFAFTTHSADSEHAADPGVLPGAGYRAKSEHAPSPGVWYQLVGVYDQPAATTRLYVNGVLEGSVKLPPTAHLWKSDGPTIVGAAKFQHNRVDYMNGAVDNVHIYPSALSASQVKDIYDRKD